VLFAHGSKDARWQMPFNELTNELKKHLSPDAVSLGLHGIHPSHAFGCGDGDSVDKKTEKVREASKRFLGMAYDGLGDAPLGKMVIGLRTPDYLELLPKMLQSLEEANRADPHYLGWARHSYNDALSSPF
jgi:hypothetical protein